MPRRVTILDAVRRGYQPKTYYYCRIHGIEYSYRCKKCDEGNDLRNAFIMVLSWIESICCCENKYPD